MSDTTTTVYSGRVTNWPLFWLMNVLALALVALVVADVQARVPLAIAAVVVLVANLTITSVRTTAGPQGVVVRFGLLGLPRFRFATATIERAEAVDVPPHRLGGLGVHWSPWRGTRLTIRSGPQLQLRRRGAKPVTITAENPRAAADVINGLT
ncbi:hypothetical protein [uncultured Jatrophihabitans sp.]|uniref:hypothetical protein n=1 Tax=uncultured Jatrophihabitans sp. TaxID=1610747 RepID=UPI0035C9DE14